VPSRCAKVREPVVTTLWLKNVLKTIAQVPANAAVDNTTAMGLDGRGSSTTTDAFFRLRKTQTQYSTRLAPLCNAAG
jgi:hypothetical protein